MKTLKAGIEYTLKQPVSCPNDGGEFMTQLKIL